MLHDSLFVACKGQAISSPCNRFVDTLSAQKHNQSNNSLKLESNDGAVVRGQKIKVH